MFSSCTYFIERPIQHSFNGVLLHYFVFCHEIHGRVMPVARVDEWQQAKAKICTVTLPVTAHLQIIVKKDYSLNQNLNTEVKQHLLVKF